jgi:hypothetical protein
MSLTRRGGMLRALNSYSFFFFLYVVARRKNEALKKDKNKRRFLLFVHLK